MQVSGGNLDSEGEKLYRALADGVAALGDHDALMVAELTPAGVTGWSVRRDPSGTPLSRPGPQASWASLYREGVLDAAELRRITRTESGSRMILVCSPPDGPETTRALGLLRAAYPEATVFRAAAPVGTLIGQAIAGTPLNQLYELVVLRRAQSGRLALAGYQLFPAGAQQGDPAPVTIRCEPSDERGTVFAVVASKRLRQFRLVSVKSVKLAPGRYDLNAELRAPGEVRFHGLPDRLREEHRSWAELVAAVPERLPPLEPVHLICAVEASGSSEQVDERLSRVRQLIQSVAGRGNDRLRVSLICYGPHAVSRGETDRPPVVAVWAGSSGEAVAELDRRPSGEAAMTGYSGAAQIECVLAHVASELTEQHGRPILVTAGSRPPFPPRVDSRSGIIPCPRRSDWSRILERLQAYPRITFGAIHDHQPEGIWAKLSRDAFADEDAADLEGFAVALGLLGPGANHVPFPLVDGERG